MGHLAAFHLVVVGLVATAFATPLLKWKSTSGTALVQEEFTSGGWILEEAFLPGRCVYPDFDVQNDGSIKRKWTVPGGYDEKAQVDLSIECTSSGLPYIYYDGVKNAEYLAVLLHGNGLDISEIARDLPQFAVTLQANIIALEYPGYGQAPGKASRDSVNQAVWDFVNDLKDNQDIDLEKVIIMGQSIGTGVAAKLARRIEEDLKTTIAGLVLISPYTSCADMVKAMSKKYLKSTTLGGALNFLTKMPKDWWNTVENVQKISCPYIVLHGSKDDLIPLSHGVAVAKANHGTLVKMRGLGHNNMYLGLNYPTLDVYRKQLSTWRENLGKKGDDSDNGGKNGDGELKRELLKMDDVEKNGNVEEEVDLEGGDTKKSPILDRNPTEEEENEVEKKGDDGDDSNQDTLALPKKKQTKPLIITTSSGVDYKGSGKKQCALVREPVALIDRLKNFPNFSKKLKRNATDQEKRDHDQEKRDHATKQQAAIAKAKAYKAWQKKNKKKKK